MKAPRSRRKRSKPPAASTPREVCAQTPGALEPCNACPWRRRSMPGWLGGSSPEKFALQILADRPLPCHKTIDYDDPQWAEKWERGEQGKLCAGALIMTANLGKLPRDPSFPRAQRSDTVFASLQDFVDHHRKHGRGSWDEAEDQWGKEAWEMFHATPFAPLVFAQMAKTRR